MVIIQEKRERVEGTNLSKRFYLDTAIWLDLFENRDEPNLPKGKWSSELISKIVKNDDIIIYSDNNIFELIVVGYFQYELEKMFKSLRPILLFVESTEKQIGLAKDLSFKRNVPKRDALHALIARDNKAILVTFDKHFQMLLDITKPKRPQDLIWL